MQRRKDSKGRVLKENETQRKDGSYMYRWRNGNGKRECIYAPTLEKLREKEENIQRDKLDGIRTDAKNVVLNDVLILWIGAFGCGAFQNKPEVVAFAAKNVIKNYLQSFKNIEFAVYCSPNDDRNYKVFERNMKDYISQ